MAEKEATLLIRLKDEASKGLAGINKSVLGLSAAFAGLTAFLADSLKSFLESDRVVVKLNASLKAQGIFTEELSREMQNFAKELQRQTTFSDEAIISSQTLLTTFGLAGKEMKNATIAATNLSAGLGIDLQTATLLVGKASNGATESLGRYGIKIDETIPSSQKFSALLNEINGRFGGAATAEVESYSGKITNLKERFDNLKEQIGEALIPAMDLVIKTMTFWMGIVERFGGVWEATFIGVLYSLKGIVSGIQIFVETMPGMSTMLGIVGVNFDELNAKIQEQINGILLLAEQERLSNESRLLNDDKFTKQRLEFLKKQKDAQLKKELEERTARIAHLKSTLDDEVSYNKKILEEDKKASDAKLQLQKMEADQMFNNMRTTFGNIAALQEAHNKFLAGIGKAAAYASAIINTSLGITIALRSTPFAPVNIGLASAVAAAGAAQIAAISGVKLAKGGVVLPTSGGTQATIGEAGRAEAVIPLGDDRASEKMREAGLGNTVNINLNVGTLVGSEDNVRTLAKMIDQELFSLRRNNESVAFEAL